MTAPAPVDDGAARHLSRGLRLPAIALLATAGQPVDLSLSRGTSVVFVYPWTGRPGLPNPEGWDDIPGAHGSTPEAESFRNLFPAFQDGGVGVYGVSTQTTDWQAEFARRLSLPFPLLSDSGWRWADALSLPRFQAGRETFLRRLTLVIVDGKIERVFYPAHPPEVHPREVLLWIDERQTR